ncbi:MAG: hypothetical protein Q7S04_02930 [Candidatus Moranbacteria bacterium]|nr:hypothetical protein [Candidatus Moranbacteria bacterium]
MLSLDQKEIEAKLDTFNWNFKVGDNIKHNIEEVFFLYKIKEENCSYTREKQFINKHISITLVAIIEGILHDFVVRLSEATNHFPLIIDDKKKKDIKKYISEQKVPFKYKKLEGRILRVKNYSFAQILKLLQNFELLESKNSPIYNTLEAATHFRNRIHIYNWFNNFETDERDVFTDKRLEVLEWLVIYILTTMEAKYSRP